MRIQSATLLGACAALALLVGQAATAGDATNNAVQFHNPDGLPRWTFSFGVSKEAWVKTASVDHILPADQSGDLKAQMASALANLDKQLAEHGSGRDSVLKLNTVFVGDSLKQTQEVAEVIKSWLDAKTPTANGSPVATDFPIRTATGLRSLDTPDLKVALDVEFVDAKATPSQAPSDAAAHRKTLAFGGVSAQQKDFTIDGYPNAGAEAKGTVNNLKKILADAGMTLKDVKTLKVYYFDAPQTASLSTGSQLASTDPRAVPSTTTPKADVANSKTRQDIEASLKSVFEENGAPLPKVEYQATTVACEQDNALVVEGTATGS
jgi:enamine deaminase RidA (YjgF/YER057c/UK114 family)